MHIALDLETTRTTIIDGERVSFEYRDKIVIASFCLEGGEPYLLFDEGQIREEVIKYTNDPGNIILIHNVNFDWRFILQLCSGCFDWNLKARLWDTMIVERALTSGLDPDEAAAALSSVALRRLGITLSKELRDSISSSKGVFSREQLAYAEKDVRVLFPIFQQQFAEAERTGMLEVTWLESDIARIAAESQHHGIYFDQELYRQRHAEAVRIRNSVASKVIHTIIDKLGLPVTFDLFDDQPKVEINLDSQPQMLEFLKKMKVPVDAFDYATLRDWWLKHPENDFVRWILDYKFWEGLTSWHYLDFVMPETGCIHAEIKTLGADTARMTMVNPNLQQCTVDKLDFSGRFGKPDGHMGIAYRECFTARPGYTLVIADLKQIEYVTLADISREDWMIRAFLEGKDFHIETGRNLLRLDREPTEEERKLGKIGNFGLGYGGGYTVAQSLAADQGVLMTDTQARMFVQGMRESRPKVFRWGKNSLESIKQNGFAQTRVGHRRWFPHSENLSPTTAMNTPIQMEAAGYLKTSVRILREALPPDCRILLYVHDEVVTEVPIRYAKEITEEVIKPSMVSGPNTYLQYLKAGVSCTISTAWRK